MREEEAGILVALKEVASGLCGVSSLRLWLFLNNPLTCVQGGLMQNEEPCSAGRMQAPPFREG